ncbi:MAG: DUF420 domain-containing protein [Gemmataceae bacterium]
MSEYDLPFLNAVLNGSAAMLLLAGYAAIRVKWARLHMTLMLSALGVSAAFLVSYLYYHFAVRHGQATKYVGEWPTGYYVLLISHTTLAPVATILALITARLALIKRFHRHLKVARWTLPIWLYVSVTGVIVYLFLRGLYPTG